MCFEIVVSYLESRTMTVPLPTIVSRKDATRLWGFSDKVYFFIMTLSAVNLRNMLNIYRFIQIGITLRNIYRNSLVNKMKNPYRPPLPLSKNSSKIDTFIPLILINVVIQSADNNNDSLQTKMV